MATLAAYLKVHNHYKHTGTIITYHANNPSAIFDVLAVAKLKKKFK